MLDSIFLKQSYSVCNLPNYEELESQYEKILAAGTQPLIIDCGANIGASSIYYNILFPDSLVIGLELNPSNAEIAQKNTQEWDNVWILNAAIGPNAGYVGYSNPDNRTNDGFRVEHRFTEGSKVPMMTFDQVLNMHEAAKPFIAKIDIEGSEKELFSGATDWINEFYAIFCEIHDWMLPGEGVSAPFLLSHSELGRDLYLQGDTVVSKRN